MTNPYEPPDAYLEIGAEPRYAGFWVRTVALIIDTIILMMVLIPLLYLAYGGAYFASSEVSHGALDMIINYVLPAVFVIAFWKFKSATPGKMLFRMKIVDADGVSKPSTGQCVGRYFGYLASALVFGLGYFWVAWDPKKQAWHDKLAGTLVIREP